MKIRFVLFALLFAVFSFSSESPAQIVKITPKKTVYKRKPAEGFEHKKTFTVTSPKVSGLTPALNKKIETILSHERAFEFTVKDEINEVFWLEDANFLVDYNNNNILSVALTIEGSGAYPSQSTKYIVVNTKTGTHLKAANLFTKLPALASLVGKSLQTRIKQSIASTKKESAEDAATMLELLGSAKFNAEHLESFSVSDKGVSFYYDYGLPHAVQALAPENRFFFTYAQLKPFINAKGLLKQFVR
ncbi:MAG: hypothetical protein JWN60_410 [Acidobacteria bacterium]|nr:hypothetical protein [Acidobacteriota bacterium]